MNRILYAVQCTRNDGSSFLVSEGGSPVAIFSKYAGAKKFKSELAEDLPAKSLKVIKVHVVVEIVTKGGVR